ncbi:MAG: hypothetical protein JOZ32_14330 [Bryobacterales bacterium]|nr:hypothetical protein [Bryobacterales bacterium]
MRPTLFVLLLGCALERTPALAQTPSAKAPGTFTLHAVAIMDSPQHIGGEAYRILAPANWKAQGGIVWRSDPSNPASPWVRLDGPRGQEIGVLPAIAFVWNPQMLGRNFPAGSRYAGTEVEPPVLDPFQCIQRIVIPRYLRNLSGAQIVKQESLPELAEVGHMKYPGPEYRNAIFRAGKVRFAYSQNGVPMEEDVYVLTAAVQFRVGPTTTTMWSPDEIRYSRAPAGELDRQLAIFQTAMFSLRPNIRWFAAVQRVSQQLVNQQIQASNAAVARAQAQAQAAQRQAEANRSIAHSGDQINDMIMQGYKRRMATQDAIAQREDRTIRQVEVFQNPNTGEQYELPSGYGSAFLGPDNTYVMGGANFNPNYSSNGSYTRLDRVPGQ